jgi:NitT/TauT family transport system substrate-binding protein
MLRARQARDIRKTFRAVGACLAVGAVALTGACGNPGTEAAGQTDGRYDLTVVQSVDTLAFLPLYVARAQGFFEKHGVNLDVTVGGTGGTEIRALVSGEAQLAFSSGAELVKINSSGKAVIGVAAINDRSVLTAVADKQAAERAGFDESWTMDRRLQFLKGKRIAVTAPGSLTDSSARFWVQAAGLDASAAEYVAAGTGAQQVAALETGKADVVAAFSPFTEQLLASGKTVTLWDQRNGDFDSFTPWLEQAVVTTPQFAANNREAVEAVAAATIEGLEWVLSHTAEESAAVIAEFEAFAQSDRAVLADQIEANMDTFSGDGAISADGLTNVGAVLEAAGVLAATGDVEAMYDNSFLG